MFQASFVPKTGTSDIANRYYSKNQQYLGETCPAPKVWNEEYKQCIDYTNLPGYATTSTRVCPVGQELDVQTLKCKRSAYCGFGFEADDDGNCIATKAAGSSCAEGTQWNAAGNRCVAISHPVPSGGGYTPPPGTDPATQPCATGYRLDSQYGCVPINWSPPAAVTADVGIPMWGWVAIAAAAAGLAYIAFGTPKKKHRSEERIDDVG